MPLLTNPDVTFFVEGVGNHLTEGEAAEVSNMSVHAADNAGSTDRIHLIFECFDLDQPAPARADALASQAGRADCAGG